MTSCLGKKWSVSKLVPEAEALARALKIEPVLGQLLWQRGFTTLQAAQAFLEPRLQDLSDPFTLTGMRRACEVIWAAIEACKRIVIFGDYDVDGITSSALLWRILTALGANTQTFLPLRMEEGYGLSMDSVERCVAEHDPQLLIAVDCGTTSVEPIAWLRKRGVEVIVIDHHALPARLPDCAALVNPQQDKDWQYLASVGLVFKTCHGLLKLRPQFQQRVILKEFIDLVAVGTVADIVPLQGENRIFVRRGLTQLPQSANMGLLTLQQTAGISRRPNTVDIGFRIGPRLNASGRLGDAMRSLDLLKTDDRQRAWDLAQELERNNRERQEVEQRTWEEAREMAQRDIDPARDRAIVLASRGWHVGVIGIVASRLMRQFYRPTVVIGIDEEGMGKGSCRSIDGFSIISGLSACAPYLTQYGGHDMAAGLSIAEKNIAAFRQAFNAVAAARLKPGQLLPKLTLDGELRAQDITGDFFAQLDMLAPFGRDNPEPNFLFKAARFRKPPRLFGKNHFKLFIEQGVGVIEAVAFGMADRQLPQEGAQLAVAVDWDDYRQTTQLKILDWMNP
jgi:single-stranded-DNA-specific exonuclease